MKAIISTTFDDKYLWFLPIVTFCWNRLGVDVICFMPLRSLPFNNGEKLNLIQTTLDIIDAKCEFKVFDCPEHKEATYAQCSRLYGACLDLPEDELLIVSDCDMVVFNKFWEDGISTGRDISILGSDLVPDGQVPMCYIYGDVKAWRNTIQHNDRTYQQCLYDLLGNIEAEHYRGNFWSKDQEEAERLISMTYENVYYFHRAREGTQFADKRYDRDDSFILDRLSPDTIDFHMNRPGYEDKNFEIILTILKYHYPDDNFDWLISYTNAYKQLL